MRKWFRFRLRLRRALGVCNAILVTGDLPTVSIKQSGQKKGKKK